MKLNMFKFLISNTIDSAHAEGVGLAEIADALTEAVEEVNARIVRADMNQEPIWEKRNGSPYDCGSADRYYGRSFSPHYYVGLAHLSEYVDTPDLTPNEIAAYCAGFYNIAKTPDMKEN